ncbi:PAS domain-containing sensor histidine kinase [Corallococcus sp. bb12-1]|uniref:sensor histidine kinase n=1 Tax=Corallococcus sp. bb12-1 TaxID=2996784 RepID=UPI00226EFFA2|nr:PAS domain-containing sensor histidine kinase [Corallococcus sp. bb12-1]MCY1045096.1 PAS domain-containing sensor histidine kinase [Corallococcus sp. bb12-1]
MREQRSAAQAQGRSRRDSLQRLQWVMGRLVPAASALLVGVGLLVLLGWGLGVPNLILALSAGTGVMLPGTALGYVSAGIALGWLHPETVQGWRRKAGRGLATVTVLLGVGALGWSALGGFPGVHRLLLGDGGSAVSSGLSRPGSALGLCLTGLALLLLHVRTRQGWYPARWLALVTLVMASWVILGFLLREVGPEPASVTFESSTTPMGLHSALLLMLLSLAILSVHPEQGLMGMLLKKDLGGLLARRLLPAALLAPLVVGVARLLGERLTLFGPISGVMLFASLMMAAFVAVTFWNAKALSRLDARNQLAEQSLRLSEARFAGIVSNAADAIISIDGAQRIVLFNASAERIFGYAASEIVGRPLEMLLPESLQAIHARHVRHFARGSMTSRHMGERLPISGRRKQGETFPAEASISKLEVEGTRILTVILRDITARKQAEEVLRNSEERFRTSFEDAPIGLALVGLDGRFLHVNASLRHIVGYSQAELLARTFQDITVPEDLELDLLNVRRLLQGDIDSYQIEKRYFHRDGRIVTTQMRASMVRDAHGAPLHFISQIQDITERKQMEQAWRFMLEKSQQATRVRDEVLRIVAHDLRAPLNVIALSAGVLRKELPESRALQRPLDSLEKSLQRANRLIQDLLDVARLEGGGLSVERELLDVAPLVREAVELHRALAEAKSLQLVAVVPEGLPTVFADRERALQIFSNLVGNALKFTPEGGSITLRVRAEGGQVRFSVRDTGPGIPPEDLPHLFEPFWQAHAKRKEGAGLGLAIVKGLVEAHGGQLGVESHPGAGSTFFFTLPAQPPEERQDAFHA